MLLEICIDCIESALVAEQGGAHRIEICSNLSSGGTTPSLGLVRQCVQRCQIPCMVMIRPHDGGFVYSDDDIRSMLHDIDAVKELGVQGVVLGALTHDGDVDVRAMKRLIQASRPLQITFHRAFDMTRDPLQALDTIIGLGVDRLLTSGQRATAEEGMQLIKLLVDRADNRLTVIAGAGINGSNVRRILEATQVREVHASASVPRSPEFATGEVRFGDHSRVTSVERVRELIAAMS
ncbi:copper homeostasis protein CutC [Novipirellula sp. SH528]|uniref:copper homeostasis protein CutC n=1 Tax=Novipirellula sp. SH528 TaxID=3454466 RepID=UPI003FA05ED0